MSTSSPAMLLPYRDVNNGEVYSVSFFPKIILTPPQVKYTLAPSAFANQSHWSDSDGEPLISSQPPPTELDEDSIMRFTATGRPMPGFKFSGLQGMGGEMTSLPQL